MVEETRGTLVKLDLDGMVSSLTNATGTSDIGATKIVPGKDGGGIVFIQSSSPVSSTRSHVNYTKPPNENDLFPNPPENHPYESELKTLLTVRSLPSESWQTREELDTYLKKKWAYVAAQKIVIEYPEPLKNVDSTYSWDDIGAALHFRKEIINSHKNKNKTVMQFFCHSLLYRAIRDWSSEYTWRRFYAKVWFDDSDVQAFILKTAFELSETAHAKWSTSDMCLTLSGNLEILINQCAIAAEKNSKALHVLCRKTLALLTTKSLNERCVFNGVMQHLRIKHDDYCRKVHARPDLAQSEASELMNTCSGTCYLVNHILLPRIAHDRSSTSGIVFRVDEIEALKLFVKKITFLGPVSFHQAVVKMTNAIVKAQSKLLPYTQYCSERAALGYSFWLPLGIPKFYCDKILAFLKKE